MSTEMPENPQQPPADQPIPPPQAEPIPPQEPAQQAPPQAAQPAPPPAPAAPAAPAGPTAEERQWGMFACLGGIFGVIVTLIIWLVQKDKMPFVNEQGKEAVNFEITVIIAWFGLFVAITILAVVLAILHLGLLLPLLSLLYPAVWVYNIVISIMAGMKANEGVLYRYPISLRLIK